VLQLSGGGGFDLRNPTTLKNIQVLQAQEGQKNNLPSSITCRRSICAVGWTSPSMSAPIPPEPELPAVPESIVIHGANNNDVINLGGGADTVYIGGVGEVVNGGAGTDLVLSAAAPGRGVGQGRGGRLRCWRSPAAARRC